MRNPDWAWDELLLVCDVLAARGWTRLLEEHREAVELSRLLRSLPVHPVESRDERFRSPGSVARKAENIRAWHPSYASKPTNGGKRDREVLEAFLADPEGMGLMARALRDGRWASEGYAVVPASEPDEQEELFEGSLLYRRHLARERNPKLRRKKIEEVLALHRRLACEVCGFDFQQVYGERGSGYAEVHHVLPLHVSGPVKNRTSDLAVLCANCHRMIHRGKQWLTPVELRELVTAQASWR